jgi:membrane associated rhomboid family serine protease
VSTDSGTRLTPLSEAATTGGPEPTNLEPDPRDTLRIFRQELRFARIMGSPVIATIALLVGIGALFLAVVLIADWMAARLNEPDVGYPVVVLLGAKNNAGIDRGEVWRFASSMVLHGGPLHLLVNGYALWVLGSVLERLYGLRRFLLVFMVAGFCGALASYLFTPQSSVGASGAIFGLLGASVVFGLKFRGLLPARIRNALTVGMLPWVAINLFIGEAFPEIDNAAHIGGLIGGALIATVLGTRLERPGNRLPALLQWAFVAASLGFLVYALAEFVRTGYECSASVDTLYQCLQALDVPR